MTKLKEMYTFRDRSLITVIIIIIIIIIVQRYKDMLLE